jgi:NitT/TauT family transport system substrate-binding protein
MVTFIVIILQQQLVDNKIHRRHLIKYGSIGIASAILTGCNLGTQKQPDNSKSDKLDRVNLGLSWVAEAEYGGFYQAVATGIYQTHGLDVSIKQGGPRVNGSLLLMGGEIDFYLGQSVDAIKAVEAGIPKITVAAIFQKEIQVLIAHPNSGNDSLAKLKGKPILVGSAADVTYWPVLKSRYGFTDNQKRPYNFNIGPFLNDKTLIQQGLLTAEPYAIESKAGFKPIVIPLADYGYNPYNFTIETTKKMVAAKPDLVQRFVDASIKGWYSYFTNPEPGNVLIKKDNPEMTDAQIAYSIKKLQEYEIVTQGDAKTLGIGAMTDRRWQSLFEDLVKVKIFKPETDYKKAYTLQFVNKGVEHYAMTK